MKNKLRIIALILMLSMLLSIGAYAESVIYPQDERSSLYILSTSLGLAPEGGGRMYISSIVCSYYTIDQIGVYKIYLYREDGHMMKMFSSSAYPAMTSYNTYANGFEAYYPGVVGTKYYLEAYFYAEDNGVGETKSMVTGLKTCT